MSHRCHRSGARRSRRSAHLGALIGAATLGLAPLVLVAPGASAGTISVLDVSSNSSYADALATWTYAFTASSSGQLSGGDQITVYLGPTVSPSSSTPTVTLGGAFSCTSTDTATGSYSSEAVQFTVPDGCSLADGASASVSLEARNPPASQPLGTSDLAIATSADPTVVHPTTVPTFTAPGSAVSGVSVTPGATVVNGSSTWAVSFTPSSSGALYHYDEVQITLPTGLGVESGQQVALSGGFSGCGLTFGEYASGVLTVTLGPGCSLPGTTQGTIGFEVTNPSTDATYAASSFSVATSEDPTAESPSSGVTITGSMASFVLTVKDATTSSTSTFTYGDSLDLTLSDTTDTPAPAGSIAIGYTTDGGASTTFPYLCGSLTLAAGSVSCTMPPITTSGTIQFTYTYSGDGSTYGPVNTGGPLLPNSVTLSPATLTVTANDLTVSIGTPITPTASVSGAVNGDSAVVGATTFTFAGTGTTSYGPSTSAPTASGTYSITPSASTVTVSPNADQSFYSVAYAPGTLVILPAPRFAITVSDPTSHSSASGTYGDSLNLTVRDTADTPPPTTTGAILYSTNGGATWVSAPSCSGLTLAGGEMSCTLSGAPAGTITFGYSYAGDANYSSVVAASFGSTFAMGRAPLVVGVTNATIGFGQTYSPSTFVRGLVNGDTASLGVPAFLFTGIDGTTYPTSIATPTAPGTYAVGYDITYSLSFTPLGSSADYTSSWQDGTLTIVAPPPPGGESGAGATPQATLSVLLPVGQTAAGAHVDLSSSGGSGSGAVSYTVVGGTAAGCAISGAALTATGPGTCVVEATKAGDGTYASATSAPVTVTFTSRVVPPPVARPGVVMVHFVATSSRLSPTARRQLVDLVRRLRPGATITLYASGDPRALASARAREVRAFLTHYRDLHVRIVLAVGPATTVRVVTNRN